MSIVESRLERLGLVLPFDIPVEIEAEVEIRE